MIALCAFGDCQRGIWVLWLYFSITSPLSFFLPGSGPIPLHQALSVRREIKTAVLSLEVYQQQQGDAAYRAQVHAAVDTLLDDVEAQMPDSTEDLPSLFTLTETVRAERGRLSGTIVQAYVERRYATYLHQARTDYPQ